MKQDQEEDKKVRELISPLFSPLLKNHTLIIILISFIFGMLLMSVHSMIFKMILIMAGAVLAFMAMRADKERSSDPIQKLNAEIEKHTKILDELRNQKINYFTNDEKIQRRNTANS